MIVQGRPRSGHMVLKIPVGERHIPACVRSFPEQSRAKLKVIKAFRG